MKPLFAMAPASTNQTHSLPVNRPLRRPACLRSVLFAVAIALGLFFCSAPAAFSQSCSMCYSTAKTTSQAGQRAISKGVLVLLIPPLGFMTLGIALAFRYSRRRDLEQNR